MSHADADTLVEEGMQVVARRPETLADIPLTYCPGCTHGTIHRLVAECLDELGVGSRTVMIAPVGCAVWIYRFFACDAVQAAHGRAPAVATGIKRARPDNIVVTYQGDGDLAAIGIAEVIHAAARGERITCVYVNNAVYGMTQGQMAPTTLLGQRTTTTPQGRDARREGFPLRICEMLATQEGVAYLERVAVIDPPSIRRTKRAIRRALEAQINDEGFSLVEVLSICPTWWYKRPQEAAEWVRTEMVKDFPLGVYRSTTGRADAAPDE
jgi:2-oxoglutarate/2-oxoacid ferredoxin oxidoreductase subunit beta